MPVTRHRAPQILRDTAERNQILEDTVARYRAAAQHIGAERALMTLLDELNAVPIMHFGTVLELAATAVAHLGDQTPPTDAPG